MGGMSRPTISDIAQAAGVSSTAVSFALNGRKGVAEPTRKRIQQIADELGWAPNSAARALSTSRVDAIGLVITAPYAELKHDAFFLQFIAGVEQALAETPTALVLKMVENFEEELDAIKQWRGQSRVDGLILVNPRPADPRPALVNQLKLPAVFVSKPETDEPYTAVHIDDALAMRTLLEDLAALGATSASYLHTQGDFSHARARVAALAEANGTLLEWTSHAAIPAGGIDDHYRHIRPLVEKRIGGTAPSVLICENEDLALAALAVFDDLNIAVPDKVGLVSWESTPGLTSRSPRVSTLERSPADLGAAAVELLRDTEPGSRDTVVKELPVPRLRVRDTLKR